MKKFLGIFFFLCLSTLLSRLPFFSPPPKLSYEWEVATEKEDGLLTVLTYNIHHGTDNNDVLRLQEMAALMHDADIVFLSELDRNFDSRSHFLDELLIFQKTLGLKYVSFAPTLERIKLFKGYYGIAILSRYPLVKTEIHYLPTDSFKEPRAAISATILWQNKEVKIWGTHLSPSLEQQKQIDYLIISAVGADLLLGDLNTKPTDVYRLKALLNLESADDKPTFPAEFPNSQIDYILYNKRLQLLDVETISVTYSDHLPVKARFKWAQ